MAPRSRSMPALVALAVVVLLAVCAPAIEGGDQQFIGRPLAEALRVLQLAGLRIVFTSATVKSDFLVTKEPRSHDLRQQLDELLAPHGLVAREGPLGIIQVVRGERKSPPSSRLSRRHEGGSATGVSSGATTAPTGGTDVRHAERVVVSPSWPSHDQEGVVTQARLDQDLFRRLHGSLADDPVLTVHTLPGVSAVDEYRSEFAVRGSPSRHAGIVIDGVPTGWLQHTAHGRGPAGSIAMLPGTVVEQATLSAGTYPHFFDDRLGPQLELTIREGSRERFALSGTLGGIDAAVVGEGPLGRTARGSWLLAARQSYSEWPSERLASSRAAFGFADVVGKIVYDVKSTQRFDLTVIGGTANIDQDDSIPPSGLGGGANQASVVNVGWRSLIGPSLVVSQRAFVAHQRFVNQYYGGTGEGRGFNTDVGYRVDLRRSLASAMLESGVEVTRRSTGVTLPPIGAAIAGSAWQRSAYIHATWSPTPALTILPGLRIVDSTLVRDRPITRWILGRWAFRPSWTVRASAGVAYQLPEPIHFFARPNAEGLRPERAEHVDLGVEHRVSNALRWQLTIFHRRERNILRDPAIDAIAGGDEQAWLVSDRNVNALSGTSRGVEIMIERHSKALSGWVAYAYGETRYTDSATGETFWADYDQRHTLSLFGFYRVADRTTLGATIRAGSNFPIPGYFQTHGDALFVADIRNAVRLPRYARLDLRADRQFQWLGRRVTLYAEVLNVLNRANVSLARGTIDRTTGEAIGFTQAIGGRRGTGGVVIGF